MTTAQTSEMRTTRNSKLEFRFDIENKAKITIFLFFFNVFKFHEQFIELKYKHINKHKAFLRKKNMFLKKMKAKV